MADGGEKARLGPVRALGLIARLRQHALAFDTIGHVATDALHFGPVIAAHVDLAPRHPARAARGCDLLVVNAGAVVALRDSAPFEHRQRRALADQLGVLLAGQGAERFIGVSDGAVCVAAQDHIALRDQKAARAFFGLAKFPIAIRHFLDLRFELAANGGVGAAPHQQQRDNGASDGEQRADAAGIGVGIEGVLPDEDAGDKTDRDRNHGPGDDDRAAEQQQCRLVAGARVNGSFAFAIGAGHGGAISGAAVSVASARCQSICRGAEMMCSDGCRKWRG